MYKVKIEHMEIEHDRRILVTSDIHGHLSYLKKVLERAQFSDDDILFIVGDIIEKGPESLKALRYVMELYERGNVIVLPGNVDLLRLRMIKELCEESAQGYYNYTLDFRGWRNTSFFDELTREFGYICQSPEDMLRSKERILEYFKPEFDFVSNLPTIVETQNYIFVHGGLREKRVGDNADGDAYGLLKYNNFMNSTGYYFDKYVVVGHWPVYLYDNRIQRLSPVIDREKKIISIDGGTINRKHGQLNLLVIPEIDCDIDNVYHISGDELPVFRALTAQEESADSINITYVDDAIRILEKGEEFTHVVHVSSGRELWVPNSYITNDTRCFPYTDYILPVGIGDKVSLIRETSKGFIVKKDDTIGWYYGKLEKAGESV